MTTYLNYLGQPMPQSADPGNTAVVGNDPNGGDTWTAPAGNSSVQGGGGGDTLVGNTGDTTFIITSPNDVVVDQAGSGIDSAQRADFSEATHNVFWLIACYGIAIIGLGIVSTGARAKASAKRVAFLLDPVTE